MPTCGDNGGRTASGDPCQRQVEGEALCYQHKEDGARGGRPAHSPDPQSRAFVEAGAMGGIPQDDLAAALGISDVTLRKHYREELDHGMTKANARVVQTAFQQATSGKSPAMTMFWLKTRMGWKETQEMEHSGEIDVQSDALENVMQSIADRAERLGGEEDD